FDRRARRLRERRAGAEGRRAHGEQAGSGGAGAGVAGVEETVSCILAAACRPRSPAQWIVRGMKFDRLPPRLEKPSSCSITVVGTGKPTGIVTVCVLGFEPHGMKTQGDARSTKREP